MVSPQVVHESFIRSFSQASYLHQTPEHLMLPMTRERLRQGKTPAQVPSKD